MMPLFPDVKEAIIREAHKGVGSIWGLPVMHKRPLTLGRKTPV